jgi:uncharacterized protein (TIGR03435 family)
MRGVNIVIGLAGLFLFATNAARGQAPTKQFEVASIRAHPDPPQSIGISTKGNRLTAEASFPGLIILYAYNLKNYQLDVPKSLPQAYDTMYDIAARAEGDGTPTQDDFRQMLQSLLADRFKLRFHREMREMPVYALVVAKGGPKLKESAPDAESMGRMTVNGRNYQASIPKANMDDVVRAIANSFIDRPVLDKTGLTGTFDLKLTYTPDIASNRKGDPDPNDISIFTAVQEQLGLKLEPTKALVEILVVDHIEKPTEN